MRTIAQHGRRHSLRMAITFATPISMGVKTLAGALAGDETFLTLEERGTILVYLTELQGAHEKLVGYLQELEKNDRESQGS